MLLFLIASQHTRSFAWQISTLPCSSTGSHEACGPLVGNSSSIQKPWSGNSTTELLCVLIWFYCEVFGKDNMVTYYKPFEHVGGLTIDNFHFKKPCMMEKILHRMTSMSKSTSFCDSELSPCIVVADPVLSFMQVRQQPAYAQIVRVECISPIDVVHFNSEHL